MESSWRTDSMLPIHLSLYMQSIWFEITHFSSEVTAMLIISLRSTLSLAMVLWGISKHVSSENKRYTNMTGKAIGLLHSIKTDRKTRSKPNIFELTYIKYIRTLPFWDISFNNKHLETYLFIFKIRECSVFEHKPPLAKLWNRDNDLQKTLKHNLSLMLSLLPASVILDDLEP